MSRVMRQLSLKEQRRLNLEMYRTNPAAQQPPPPPNSQPVPVAPQVVELQRLNKPPVDKIRKYEAEEFRATVDDDPERAEFWLESTINEHTM
ncbi:Gag-Pol polyprotein [Gossypium australe]|uniref:Gag-Pol polyprotein n=1 Tax=Gossypium australe TaxID=47621 RepID=A0A5B6WQZ9_9ROSI|nr:Gag-Pol polyprotein [Gossypium australe]